MKKKRTVLSLWDRLNIWKMREDGYGVREIGRTMSRDPSIISRELKRNKVPVGLRGISALERGRIAQDLAEKRQKGKRRGYRKARPSVVVYEHIAQKLSEQWSPEAISARWGERFPGESISTSTIYRMIKNDWPELKKYLPEKGIKRRANIVGRRGRVQQAAAEKRHISARPEAANNREEEGHLEIDSIIGIRGSKGAIISIIDRKKRRRWYRFVPNLEAATVRKELVIFLHSLKEYQRRSLTMDRGSEFAEWKMLEHIFEGLKVYFCTAYSPHEKGSVERSNRDFRRLFPKGTNFSVVSLDQFTQAEELINNKPMKCLHWKSPTEAYNAFLASREHDYRNAA